MKEKAAKNNRGEGSRLSNTSEQAHTRTPWNALGPRVYRTDRLLFDGGHGADFPGEREANARFVVKAVNSYAEMREWLRSMTCPSCRVHMSYETIKGCDHCAAARAALRESEPVTSEQKGS